MTTFWKKRGIFFPFFSKQKTPTSRHIIVLLLRAFERALGLCRLCGERRTERSETTRRRRSKGLSLSFFGQEEKKKKKTK